MTWTINGYGHSDGDEPKRRAAEEKAAAELGEALRNIDGFASCTFQGNYHTETITAAPPGPADRAGNPIDGGPDGNPYTADE